MKRISFIAVLLLPLVLTSQVVPNLINYQGRLTDQTGGPLPIGTYSIQFRLWDSPNATAVADLIWAQQQGVIIQSNGVFNVILGAPGKPPIPGAAVTNLADAFAVPVRYLGLTVVSNSAGPILSLTEISPRQQLLSVPFAVQAQQAQVASSLVSDLADALCPPGTVIAWMGSDTNALPHGWALCWGQAVLRSDPTYARLFGTIGTSSGVGDGLTTFNIPDLRGMFLRGVNGSRTGAFADPDVTSRTILGDSSFLANAVGSVQSDLFRSHSHMVERDRNLAAGGNAVFGFYSGTPGPWDRPTDSQGGAETRPKNVYVQYLIKL
jgi:Phage Tail Collar Domain